MQQDNYNYTFRTVFLQPIYGMSTVTQTILPLLSNLLQKLLTLLLIYLEICQIIDNDKSIKRNGGYYEYCRYRNVIDRGQTSLGIELGSTRIKAVLIGDDHSPIASGDHAWENKLVDGVWTYSLEDVWNGLQSCYRSLCEDVQNKYGRTLTRVGSIGISAMMHGYLAFDSSDNLLVPFRTWRNTITEEAAAELTSLFDFNIPQRWSIAHLYQAVLNGEDHINDISHITTLAGYVHMMLTGEKVVGIGDASGIFPIDSEINDYNQDMISQFDRLESIKDLPWNLRDILPAC